MNSSTIIALAGLALAALTTGGGIFQYILTSQKKSYAAERDFNHLKRNYEQLAQNQQLLLKEFEERSIELRQELREQKILLNTVLTQIAGDRSVGSAGHRRDGE